MMMMMMMSGTHLSEWFLASSGCRSCRMSMILGCRRKATILSLYASVENLFFTRAVYVFYNHLQWCTLRHSPTGTTSWYWLRLEPLKVLEGRGMTGGLAWRESSTTCDNMRHLRFRSRHASDAGPPEAHIWIWCVPSTTRSLWCITFETCICAAAAWHMWALKTKKINKISYSLNSSLKWFLRNKNLIINLF